MAKELSSVEEAIKTAVKNHISEVPKDQRQVGPATNGFSRSPDLVLHIAVLNQLPMVDLNVKIKQDASANFHHFIIPHDDTFISVVKQKFRTVRNRAMIDGDEDGAIQLCHFVLCFAHPVDNWDEEALVGQMQKDFLRVMNLGGRIEEEERKREQDFPLYRPLVLSIQWRFAF